MNITKKLDRAFQWAGEKMGAEAKTTMSEDFKLLETEMALRFDGELLQTAPSHEAVEPTLTAFQAWSVSRDR